MKEIQWRNLPKEITNLFGVGQSEEGVRTISLGPENRQVAILFGDSSVAIMHHLGDRVAASVCPVEFDSITSWKIKGDEVLFRRQIKGFDETLKIFSTGEYAMGTTNPEDWVE